MYPNREVFAKSPLALVTAEVRFTDVARLRQQRTRDEVTLALEGRFPYAEPFQQTAVTMTDAGPTEVVTRSGVVLLNTTSTESLTITADSLTFETTTYSSFDMLIDAVTTACDALLSASAKPALRRIGLRYIDEIVAPVEIADVREWTRWINPPLVGQLLVGPETARVTTTQSSGVFELGDRRWLTFRCAALDQGPVVVPQHLKRPPAVSGPFFVLDFDGFEDFGAGDTVPFSTDVVVTSLTKVHAPCGEAFQRSITDQARELFRGRLP